jgi:hypothetical protein
MNAGPSNTEFEADLRAIAQRSGGAAPEFAERLLAAGRVPDHPGEHTGLLIVDVQHAFSPRLALTAGIAALALRYAITAATRFVNGPGSLYRRALDWHGCSDGPDTRLAIDFIPGIVVDKWGYGLPRHAVDRLTLTGITEWHLCGLETDACVLAVAYSLWDAGMRPFLLADLCASVDPALHAAAVDIFARQFGADSVLR